MKKLTKLSMIPMLSGALLVLSFPTFDYHWLAFVALTPFIISICGQSMRKSFFAGFLLGLPYFFGTNYWIYNSMNMYGGLSVYLSYLLVFILSVYLSLYTAIFASLFQHVMNRTSIPALFVAPVIWTVIEYLRSTALTGFPYSLMGYTQHTFTEFIQLADITGVYGISFLVVAVNGAIADIFITKKRLAEKPLFHVSPTVIGHVILVLVLGLNYMYGSNKLSEEQSTDTLNVAIVQPNVEQDAKWNPIYQTIVLDKMQRMTASISNKTDLIIWPETALPFYYGLDKYHTDTINEFINNKKVPVLTGAITIHSKTDTEFVLANSAILLEPGKTKYSYKYNKTHLVPFGEYVPLQGILGFVDKMVEGIGAYAPGAEYNKGIIKDKKFGSIICYEIAFPSLVRKFFKKDGDFLVIITNDAWFGRTTGPYHHFAMAVFRAIENRKPVIRAANTGISGFIDSKGRIIEQSKIFTETIINKEISLDSSKTIYSKYGDLFIYFCTIITIILIAETGRRKN